jgi:two-component system NtrC family response regulator
MTGHDEREHALRAIEKGAYDFYTKPVSVDDLRIILSRAMHIYGLEKELEALRSTSGEDDEFSGIIAMSPVMQSVFDTVRKVAPADVSVLVTGESGTGKELVARAIHRLSRRREAPFIAINCGAIPESLLESELFGHEKGSFTGAHASRPGKLELGNGGTVFLDEIGELTPPLQVKLLRFPQDQTIERIGGREILQVDVRVVAATNQDLEDMIGARSFREDLFYRINTIRIILPPLRERDDDILLIATRFLHRFNRDFGRNVRGFSDAAIEKMYTYAWPGNVRELDNRVKRAVLMASGPSIMPEDLDLTGKLADDSAENSVGPARGPASAWKTLRQARDEVEKTLIVTSLLRSFGNVSTTARELDISRPTLHDMMKKHGIDPARYRRPSPE